MVNVRTDRCPTCLEEHKVTVPAFNYPNETKGLYCKAHKLEGMTARKGAKCVCGEIAYYAEDNKDKRTLKPTHCSEHRSEDMIVVTATCKECWDERKERVRPLFNIKGSTTGKYCREHAKPGMRFVGTYCTLCDYDIVSSRTFCFPLCQNCWLELHPDDERAQHIQHKQNLFTEEFKKEFEDTFTPEQVIYDRIMPNGISKRRGDIVINCYTHYVVVELDENQHRHPSYTPECTETRINNLVEDGKCKPMAFIHFNPDGYKEGNKSTESCFQKREGKWVLNQKEWTRRLTAVFDKVEEFANGWDFTSNLTQIKKFYYTED
ncbi:Uncharacterised protein [uncultured archaeon]|nr:Uncharacterised protein [uncultured archaeon]